MSWSCGENADHRDVGYRVPATCDHPECEAAIDRGIAYVCGGEHDGGEYGCGLYFCEGHLWMDPVDDVPNMCERCCDEEPPFSPKPDVDEWVQWKLTDASWEKWRSEHPGWVVAPC